MVMDVRPIGDKWKISFVDKPTGKVSVTVYDSVMVCNGHYNDPIIPTLPGEHLQNGNAVISN